MIKYFQNSENPIFFDNIGKREINAVLNLRMYRQSRKPEPFECCPVHVDQSVKTIYLIFEF